MLVWNCVFSLLVSYLEWIDISVDFPQEKSWNTVKFTCGSKIWQVNDHFPLLDVIWCESAGWRESGLTFSPILPLMRFSLPVECNPLSQQATIFRWPLEQKVAWIQSLPTPVSMAFTLQLCCSIHQEGHFIFLTIDLSVFAQFASTSRKWWKYCSECRTRAQEKHFTFFFLFLEGACVCVAGDKGGREEDGEKRRGDGGWRPPSILEVPVEHSSVLSASCVHP